MVWDGLGFFGTDHTKLNRLKGEKVNFWTPFKSYKVLILSTIGFIVAVTVILMEFNKLGKEKSQTISLVQRDGFSYNYTDALALHGGNWFYVDEIFKHINNH